MAPLELVRNIDFFPQPIKLARNYFGQRMESKSLKSGSMAVENKFKQNIEKYSSRNAIAKVDKQY